MPAVISELNQIPEKGIERLYLLL